MATDTFITPSALLDHWQGHRRLTRRVIEAFPEDQLFTFRIGSMRTFGEMTRELLSMGAPMLEGLVSGNWKNRSDRSAIPRDEILRQWDEDTARINELWPKLTPERFTETETAFGIYTDKVHTLVLYVIDNEIHHRAQGFTYLRSLGVEPPPFYERT